MCDQIKLKTGEMKDVTPAMLVMLERLAAVHFKPEEIASFFLADREWMYAMLIRESPHSFYFHFRKGCLQSELEIREAVFDMAKRNSAPAQELAKKIIDQQKTSMA